MSGARGVRADDHLTVQLILLGEGPAPEAARARETVSCDDILSEGRWPRFRAIAFRTGVRSFLTQAEAVGDALIILTLWAVRPNGFRAVARSEFVQRTATQLQEAVESRAVIDQAKGVLMQALGCDAEMAFHRLREESQRTNTKVVDVARKVLNAAAHSAAAQPGTGRSRQ